MERMTHPDKLRFFWQRKKYFIEDGFAKPVPGGEPVRYNPFDYYKPSKPGKRATDNLHHQFANIDLSDNSAIERFYTKYGPLGFYERDIIKIVAFRPDLPEEFPMPKRSPLAAVKRESNELMPLEDLIWKYHIPEEKLPIPGSDDLVLPSFKITAMDTWESVEDFKKECIRFKWVMELRDALKDKNIDKIRDLLTQQCRKNFKSKDISEKEVLLAATGHIMWEINGQMQNRAYPSLDYNESGYGISKNVTWRCDSLLTALYVMLYLDTIRDAIVKRCKKCGNFFETCKANARFCTPSCQTAFKSKKHRDKKKREGGSN